jgi:hypothetical protein
MAITAKFNLKIIQINAVNIFIHCNLNKVVYIKLLLGYIKKGKVLYL